MSISPGFLQNDQRQKRPGTTVPRFPLLWYFLGASIPAIVAITLITAFLFVRYAEASFIERSKSKGTDEAVHFSALFYHSVWIPALEQNPNAVNIQGIDPVLLEVFASRTTFGLNIVHLGYLNLQGATFYSTDRSAVGKFPPPGSPFWTSAERGLSISGVLRHQTATTSSGEERTLDLVETFSPLFDAPPNAPREGRVIGFLQITQDITKELDASQSTTLSAAALGSVSMGFALFSILLLIVFNADREIASGHTKLVEQQRELQEKEEQLIQSAKLATIGEIASGVAHELNNPLSGIWALSELMAKKANDSKLKDELTLIHNEAERSLAIIKDILFFARHSNTEKTYASVNAAVKAALDLRRYQLRANDIELETHLQPDLPNTMVDVQKIQQVALNLIVNAEHAMVEAQGKGKLVVKTERVGNALRLVVSDNGPGIPQENMGNIFDPFFSTKEAGKGTGLGLTICSKIVQEHGGKISVESETGKGASFLVELPIESPTPSRA